LNYLFKIIVYKFKYLITFFTIVILLSIFFLSNNEKSFLTGIGDIKNSESLEFSNKNSSEFEYLVSNNLVISIRDKSHKNLSLLNKFEKDLLMQKEISDTLSNIESPLPFLVNNSDTYIISITLKGNDFSNYEKFTPKLRNFISKNLDKNIFEYYVTGNAAFSYDINELSERQGREAELKVLLITLIFTIILFGSLNITILVSISAIITTLLTITALKLINIFYGLSIFSVNISSMLGLGLSIDYSLILVSRYREERKFNSIEKALFNTFNTAGKTIILSGLAVLIGFIALFIPQLNLADSIAIGGVFTILFSVLNSIFLILPSLAIIDSIKITNKSENYIQSLYTKTNLLIKSISKKFSNKYDKITIFIDNEKIVLSILSISLLILFSLPVLNMKLAEPSINIMPNYCESKKGFDLLNKASKGNIVFPILALVETEKNDIFESNNITQITKLINQLSVHKKLSEIHNYQNLISTNIFSTISFSNNKNLDKANKIFVSKDKKKALLLIIPSKDIKNFEVNDLINELRHIEVKGLNIIIGGPLAIGYDLAEKLYLRIKEIVFFIYFITFILLFISFKSILIPLKAIFLNTLSILASYGFLVLVFQYGYGNNLIGVINSPEAILSGIPVLLFCTMFSLSMDYEVFILSRVYEEYKKTYDNDISVTKGLKETSVIILKAASIMILVFAAFIQADIIMIKMVGLGLAFAIFLDVTIVRLILVPSLMKFAGKYNWLEKPKKYNN
jgi:RND superfamily putative drug exporter